MHKKLAVMGGFWMACMAGPSLAQEGVASEAVMAAGPCMRAHSPAALSTPIDPESLEGRLMDQAMRMEVNYHRCVAGLEPVMDSQDLAMQAVVYALQTVHPQKDILYADVPKEATPKGRAAQAGFVAVGVENTGWMPWMDIMGGGAARDPSLGACGFTGVDGHPAVAFNYAHFAREAVEVMMEGETSRSNMLHPGVVAMGTGVAYSPEGGYCGALFVVQALAG